MHARVNTDHKEHVHLVRKVHRLKAAHKALAARVAILEAQVAVLKKGGYVATRSS